MASYNKRDKKEILIEFFVILFFIFTGLHKASWALTQEYGLNIQKLIGIKLLYFPLLFLFFAFFFAHRYNFIKLGVDSFYVRYILFYCVFLLFLGLLSQNFLTRLVEEVWTAFLVFFSYKLGSLVFLWNLFRRILFYLYIIFSFFVYIGLNHIREDIQRGDYDIERFTGLTVNTEAYNISPILDFWPFILLIGIYSPNISKVKRLLFLLPFFIYLFFQVYFLKRAPSFRAVFLIAAAVYFFKKRNFIFSLRIIFILVFIFLLYIYLIPQDLIDRFNTDDTSRQDEFLAMIRNSNFIQLIFGKGFGGEFTPVFDGVFENVRSSTYLKSTLHIGVGDTILKGGLVFFVLIFLHIFKNLQFGFNYLNKLNEYGKASFVFLFVFSVFRLIEGGLTPGSIFNAYCYGVSLGYLDSLNSK